MLRLVCAGVGIDKEQMVQRLKVPVTGGINGC